jgi:protein TonB
LAHTDPHNDALAETVNVGVIARGEIAFEAGTAPVPDQVAPQQPLETAEPVPDSAQPEERRAEMAPEEPPPTPVEVEPTQAKRDVAENDARAAAQPARAAPPAIAMARAASRVGADESRSAAAHAAQAKYAALVSAEINRHKHYPASARQRGAQGSVGVVFVIGNGGTLQSYAVTQSAGNAELDAATHRMMGAAKFSPPPGGLFRGSIVIRFRVR